LTHECALRSLSAETKALIVINEFEAQRMPMPLLRQVFAEIIVDDEERKAVVGLIKGDLAAGGYAHEHVEMFLARLLMSQDQATAEKIIRTGKFPRCSKPFEDAPAAVPKAPPTSKIPSAWISPSGAGSPRKGGEARPPQEMRGALMLPREFVMGDAPPRKPMILVADDDKRSRLITRVRLEEAGFLVAEAINGVDAWQRISGGAGLALVILDMKMPGMHGLEVLAKMAEARVSLPIIVCSAFKEFRNEPIILSNARLKYLTKPLKTEELMAAVKELLGIS